MKSWALSALAACWLHLSGCTASPARGDSAVNSDAGMALDAGLDPNQWNFLSNCQLLEVKSENGVEIRIFDCSQTELCLPFENYGFWCGS